MPMPDLLSRLQAIVSWSKRWRKTPIVAVVVFILTLILGDILITPVHPYIVGLLDTTWQSVASLNVLSWLQQNIPLISFFIASIVVGILAQWQINQAQDRIEKDKRRKQRLELAFTKLKDEYEKLEKENNWQKDVIKGYEKETKIIQLHGEVKAISSIHANATVTRADDYDHDKNRTWKELFKLYEQTETAEKKAKKKFS